MSNVYVEDTKTWYTLAACANKERRSIELERDLEGLYSITQTSGCGTQSHLLDLTADELRAIKACIEAALEGDK